MSVSDHSLLLTVNVPQIGDPNEHKILYNVSRRKKKTSWLEQQIDRHCI